MESALRSLLSNRSSTAKRSEGETDLERLRKEYLEACGELKKIKFTARVEEEAQLVKPIFDASIPTAISEFRAVHDFLVSQIRTSIAEADDQWAINTRRLRVDLRGTDRPPLVGKDAEKLAAVLNAAAILERLIAALNWFSREEDFRALIVAKCRASSDDVMDSFDIMLSNERGKTKVLCEVCDIASGMPGQQRKQREYLWRRLGCQATVPDDGVRRFICTSPEFAAAFQKETRENQRIIHDYRVHQVDEAHTMLLEIVCQG
jgi:hypothetical protein